MTQCIWLLWPNGPGIGLGHRVQGSNPANFSNHPFFAVFGGWKFQKRGGLRNPVVPGALIGLKSWKGKHAWHSAFDSCGLTHGVFGGWKFQKRGGLRNPAVPGALIGLKSWKGKHTWHGAFESYGLTDQALGLGTRLESRQFLKPPVFCSFRGLKVSKRGWFEKSGGSCCTYRSEVLKREVHMTQCIWVLWPNGPGIGLGYKAGIPPISQTTRFLEFSGAESFKKGVVWEIGRFLAHLGLKSWKGKHTWHSAFDSCGLPFLEFSGPENFKKGVVWETGPQPYSLNKNIQASFDSFSPTSPLNSAS